MYFKRDQREGRAWLWSRGGGLSLARSGTVPTCVNMGAKPKGTGVRWWDEKGTRHSRLMSFPLGWRRDESLPRTLVDLSSARTHATICLFTYEECIPYRPNFFSPHPPPQPPPHHPVTDRRSFELTADQVSGWKRRTSSLKAHGCNGCYITYFIFVSPIAQYYNIR